MHTLSELLHELIDHAVPQGNKRGELHGLVDELAAPEPSAPPKSAVPPVKLTAPSDGAPES